MEKELQVEREKAALVLKTEAKLDSLAPKGDARDGN